MSAAVALLLVAAAGIAAGVAIEVLAEDRELERELERRALLRDGAFG